MATGPQAKQALAADDSLAALVAEDSVAALVAEDLAMRTLSLRPTIKMTRSLQASLGKTGLLNASLTCSASNRTRMATGPQAKQALAAEDSVVAVFQMAVTCLS